MARPELYLLLTPVLTLGVLALVRFIGCEYFIEPEPPVDPPENLVARAGNQSVTLTWNPPPAEDDVTSYLVKRGNSSGVYEDAQLPVPNAQTMKIDSPLPNGVTKFYVVVALRGDKQSVLTSNEASATPGQGLITLQTLGTLRNDFTGFAGMLIRIAGSSLPIVGLGRTVVAGNGATHIVKVVDPTTGIDIPNASTVVDLSSPAVAAGTFAYGLLPAPVVLAANTEYYVVSQEAAGGDQFYDLDTTVETMPVASVTSAVFGDGISNYTRGGVAGHTYGPVDVLF